MKVTYIEIKNGKITEFDDGFHLGQISLNQNINKIKVFINDLEEWTTDNNYDKNHFNFVKNQWLNAANLQDGFYPFFFNENNNTATKIVKDFKNNLNKLNIEINIKELIKNL